MASRDIILYHYSFSPYARRIVWYLNLRRIPYTECIQPPILPRPSLATLGIAYRRIPLLAIGRDIYVDSRLIIRKLDALFPPCAAHPGLSSPSPALEALLASWATDGGLFAHASALLPPTLPLLRDPAFAADRAQMTGKSWAPEDLARGRSQALVEVREALRFVEESLLGGGGAWVAGAEAPSLADLEAVWPFHWLLGLPGALPGDVAGAEGFPRVWAWVGRWQEVVSRAKRANGRPESITGDEAAERILKAEYAEPLGMVEEGDPSGLRAGEEVLVYPTDTGRLNKDRGRLVALDGREIVVEVGGEGGTVRVHAPRHGFRVVKVGEEAKL